VAAAVERRQFVVIGCGLVGLSACAELARRGHDVLALERTSIGHEWSGSKGGSRVFRIAYDHPLYVRMALESLTGWRDLEKETGEQLLTTTGLLSFGDRLPELQTAMSLAGATPLRLEAAAVRERYPMIRIEGPAVLEEEAGVLAADKVLAALAEVARRHGAELRTGGTAVTLEERGDAVRVGWEPVGQDSPGGADQSSNGRLNGEVVEASAVIVCAGPGTRALVSSAGLNCETYPTLEQVAYFTVPAGALPCMTRRDERPPLPVTGPGTGEPGATTAEDLVEVLGIYGLPAASGVYKFGLHRVGPDAIEGTTRLEVDHELLGSLAETASTMIEGLEPEAVSVERCVYDNTGDGHFVIDRVGRVVLAAGTSGHGFKFGPAFGRVLADLATGLDPGLDLTLFSRERPGVRRRD
jgi:sarcosine oxidase